MPSGFSIGGSLSPNTFRLDGVSYEIFALYHAFNVGLYLILDSRLPPSALSQLTLRIGSNSYSLSSAEVFTIQSIYEVYSWPDSNNPFQALTAHSVSLSLLGSGSSSGRGRSESATPTPIKPWVDPRTCEHLPAGLTVSGAGVGEQCQMADAVALGNADFVAAGFLKAVDVWSYLGAGVTVCFEGSGELAMLDASTAPRTPYVLTSYTSEGSVCTFIDRPGTVVLLPAEVPLLANLPLLEITAPGMSPEEPEALLGTSDTRDLSGCMVTATHVLNLRDGPAGAVFGFVMAGWRLTATGRTADWFEVDVHGVTGWISADYVTTEGDCAA